MKRILFFLFLLYVAWGLVPQMNFVKRIKAERGNAHAQWELGVMYFFGDGVPLDDVEAVKWFRKAAMQGHPYGMDSLSAMYDLGWGVPRDEVEALAWELLSGAPSNYLPFSISLDGPGRLLARWPAWQKKELKKWFRKAAMQGHPYGMDSLSAMYDLGWGVPRDEVEALAWKLLTDAISNSDSPPSISFDNHMDRDEVEAYAWKLLADATSNSGMLTAGQRKEVQARARAAELYRLIKKERKENPNPRIGI